MNVIYLTKNVWGNELRYPITRDAKLVCELMGTKTLTDIGLHVLERYGITAADAMDAVDAGYVDAVTFSS